MRNEPVLTALKKLTNEDFGYDKVRWDSWWRLKYKALSPPKAVKVGQK